MGLPNGSTGSGSSEELVVVLCGASLFVRGCLLKAGVSTGIVEG